jgi:hypothetical protein
MTWLAGDYVDYAPSGIPDFSQCRPEWGQPGSPGQWTYSGPVAVADALWWLDSVAEPDPRPPSEPHDGHALVTAYPVFGPAPDDHDPANLFPLVEDLALRGGTDGRGLQEDMRGTRWENLVAAVDGYVRGRRLADTYRVTSVAAPSADWIATRVAEGAGTVLFLGVWEAQGDAWKRVGGHYAAVAGADGLAGSVALADPLADIAGIGGAGRAIPADPKQHSCREAPRAHDQPGVVSYDQYSLSNTPALPDDRHVLDGYFTPANYHEAAAFQGQDPSDALKRYRADWQRGPVVMAVDGALAVSPIRPAVPTPQPSATATEPPATATPTATSPIGPISTATGASPVAQHLYFPFALRPRISH